MSKNTRVKNAFENDMRTLNLIQDVLDMCTVAAHRAHYIRCHIMISRQDQIDTVLDTQAGTLASMFNDSIARPRGSVAASAA